MLYAHIAAHTICMCVVRGYVYVLCACAHAVCGAHTICICVCAGTCTCCVHAVAVRVGVYDTHPCPTPTGYAGCVAGMCIYMNAHPYIRNPQDRSAYEGQGYPLRGLN